MKISTQFRIRPSVLFFLFSSFAFASGFSEKSKKDEKGEKENHQHEERVISGQAFPDVARFFRDPLFSQLLSLLFSDADSSGTSWKMAADLTSEQLDRYMDLANAALATEESAIGAPSAKKSAVLFYSDSD